MDNIQCYQADAHRYTSRTCSKQHPDILVPHYDNQCSCFSCRWVRETKFPFVLSKMQHDWLPYPVVNPTHDRVPQHQRQRLLAPVAKERFQIMYIYAMQIEEKTWGWVVVLPLPLLPFLLTDKAYSHISSVSRHPKHGWFGLENNGQRVPIGHAMSPPLYNPLYQHYGYEPRCSPYRLYRPTREDKTLENKARQSSDNDTWLENPEWVVYRPKFANSPEQSGHSNNDCQILGHTGNRYTDRRNTTIFVGGLGNEMTREALHYWFQGFGELLHVRKGVGQTCGFVQYTSREEAEMAMSQMQGFRVQGARFRLSWGDLEKRIDPEYWEYYRVSACKAHEGWKLFDLRMLQGKPRKEDDPFFWQARGVMVDP